MSTEPIEPAGGDKQKKNETASQKAKNEALLTAGMGYGKRKQNNLEAFWSIILPGLLNIGWTVTAGEGDKEGCMMFVPPNVDVKVGKKNFDFYERIKAVIERVEERRNKEEAKLADKFREKTRNDQDIELAMNPAAQPRRGPGRPPKLGSSLPPRNVRVVDISWKDGGTTYPKRSSQIGCNFQVSSLPPSGSHRSKEQASEPSSEMIWDNLRGNSGGVTDYLDAKVPFNKKEKALEEFHKKKYSLDHASQMIKSICPTDCSSWTQDEKELFRLEIFRKRKDFKSLCDVMKKDMGDILSYYLGTYKKSDDYRLLKTVLIEEKIEKARSSLHHIDECAICEDGGSLLICDGCESEWHMTCTRPALKEVPEGHWECDLCVDRKFLGGLHRVLRTMGFQSFQSSNNKRKVDDSDAMWETNEASELKILEAVKVFSSNLDSVLTSRTGTEKRKEEVEFKLNN